MSKKKRKEVDAESYLKSTGVAFEIEHHDKPVSYTFKTNKGKISTTEEEILNALKEQSERTDDNISCEPEDLQGWSIIHATDEKGKSRPFCIMRSLPGLANHPHKLHEICSDDQEIRDLLIKEVYNLNPFKIKLHRLKFRIRRFLKGIFKK